MKHSKNKSKTWNIKRPWSAGPYRNPLQRKFSSLHLTIIYLHWLGLKAIGSVLRQWNKWKRKSKMERKRAKEALLFLSQVDNFGVCVVYVTKFQPFWWKWSHPFEPCVRLLTYLMICEENQSQKCSQRVAAEGKSSWKKFYRFLSSNVRGKTEN